MDSIDESADDYELVHKKIKESTHERQVDGERFAKFEDRRDDSELTKEDIIKHATGNSNEFPFKVTVYLERCFQFFVCHFVNTHRTPTTYISMESL